jgi:signal transduction histidine kinase
MYISFKKIHYLIFALSVIFSGIIIYVVLLKIFPFKLTEAVNKALVRNNFLYFYYDIDKDKYSENIKIENYPLQQRSDIKIYENRQGKFIINNQYNFKESIAYDFINYYYIDNDGTEELFVFSHDNVHLYLSIIDYRKKEFLIYRQPVLDAPLNNLHTNWDIAFLNSVFSDINGDGTDEFIFTIHSGYSHSPRGIFAYDIKKKSIIRRFLFNAGAPRIFALDLDKDGNKELIVSASATGNFPDSAAFSDSKSWLMVFNNKLRLSFPAKSFGSIYGGVQAYPITVNDENFILAFFVERNKNNYLMIIDKTGKIIHKRQLPGKCEVISIDYNEFKKVSILVFSNKSNSLYVYNDKLNIKRIIKNADTKYLNILQRGNVVGDKKPEFLCCNNDGFFIKDKDFKTVAFYPLKNEFVKKVSLKNNGSDNVPQLAFMTNKYFYTFNISQNKIYNYLPFLFIVLVIIFYGILIFFHFVQNKIWIYLSYFIYSIKNSDNAILLLNQEGKIISFNPKVKNTLRLNSTLKHKVFYKEVLNKREDICIAIEESCRTKKQIKREISFEDAQSTFIGIVTITPFFSLFKFANALLVEIKDSTHQILADRRINSQRTIQKMVHDIKTPLGGVQIKLQTIYLRLSEQYPQAADDLQEDMEEANKEIKRILNISKDFLKFSDLDAPQIRPVNLRRFIDRISLYYISFQNDSIVIEVKINNNLPDTIYIDERQIELLMHILIENAIDAVKGKGLIQIVINSQFAKINSENISVKIIDNGPGIGKEDRQKIFEPHFSTKREGTGMGLVFAKHIVQQHGGTIDVYHNNGTIFEVILPVKGINVRSNSTDE